MATRGRKCKYDTNIKPNFSKISSMLQDMTELQVAKAFNVSHTVWCEYKIKYPEFAELIKNARMDVASEMRSILKKRARGFQYEERKIIKENGVVVKEEILIKTALPDVASINLLLKNYDKENWANDPQALELKREELEIKKNNNWY